MRVSARSKHELKSCPKVSATAFSMGVEHKLSVVAAAKAHVSGLAALFALFVAGVMAFDAGTTQLQPSLVNVESILTSHEILYNGKNGTSVCQFENLVMFEGRLIYIYKDTPPILPEMLVFWAWKVPFEVELRSAANLTDAMRSAQVAEIPIAAMVYRMWHHNFYHAFGEDIFTVYNLACKYLHICGDASNRTELTPLFIEKYGEGHPSWAQVLPAAHLALRCFFPGPSYYLQDADLKKQVVVLKKSAVGVGPYERKFRWTDGGRSYAEETFQAVDKDIAVAYRKRLFECFAVKHPVFEPSGRFHVTFINRHWESSRHMVNAVEIAKKIRSMPEVASVRIVYLEAMSFEEQIKVFASAQLVLMTHGAALTGTLFMAPGTTLVEYSWLQSRLRSHAWVLDYMEDLHLSINFVGQSNRDRRLIYPMKEKFIHTLNYAALGAEEKAALLEQGECPAVKLEGCDELLSMNFAADWDVLRPALEVAFEHDYKSPDRLRTILDESS